MQKAGKGRKKHLTNIENAAANLEMLLQNSPNLSMILDKDGIVEYCSEALLRAIGHVHRDKIIHHHFRELYGLFASEAFIKDTEDAFQYIKSKGLEEKELFVDFSGGDQKRRYVVQSIPLVDGSKVFRGAYVVFLNALDPAEVESQQRLKIMLNSMPLSCIFFAKGGKVLDCNDVTLRLLGVSNREDLAELFYELIPEYQPDGVLSAKRMAEQIAVAYETGRAQYDFLYTTMIGDPLPVEVTLQRVPWQGEDRLLLYAHDKRALQMKEMEVLEASERLQLMLDSMPFACIVWMDGTSPIDCNQQTLELFGCVDKAYLLTHFFRFFPLHQADGSISARKVKKMVAMAFKKGDVSFRWDHITMDGQPLPVEVTLRRMPWRDGFRVVAYLYDLRKLNATQEDLARMYHIVDAAPLLISYMDTGGNIEYINPTVAETAGFSQEALLSRGWSLILGEERFRAISEQVRLGLEEHSHTELSLDITNHNGEKRSLEVVLFNIVSNHHPKGIGLAAKDVTELKAVQSKLVASREREATRSKITMDLLARASDMKDRDTGYHIHRTKRYVQAIVEDLLAVPKAGYSLTHQQANDIIEGCILHDIGKIAIPDAILLKPSRLTDEETVIMKTHVQRGVEMLREALEKLPDDTLLQATCEMIDTHHERWDGTGYNKGLKGDQIPLSGRISAIADVFDALTSTRPYKKAFSAQEAFRLLWAGDGTQFDPYLMEIVRRHQAAFETILADETEA